MIETFDRPDAFLLGRRTYDIFAGALAQRRPTPTTLSPASSTASRSTSPPRTLRDPGWANTTVLRATSSGPSATSRPKPGNELQVHGSGRLLQFLLQHDLLDRLQPLVFPVIVGAGRRLFPDGASTPGSSSSTSRTTPSGVQISTYRPAGRATYGEAAV